MRKILFILFAFFKLYVCAQYDTVLLSKGYKMSNNGNYKKALVYFTAVIDQYKNNPEAYKAGYDGNDKMVWDLVDVLNSRAECYVHLNKFNEAINDYQSSLRISNYSITQNDIGTIYLKMNNIELAKSSFERAIKLDTTLCIPINNLAGIFYLKKDYKLAENYMLKAIQLEYAPGNLLSYYYYNLACIYFNDKNYQKALTAINKSIELSYQSSKETFEKMYTKKTSSVKLIYVSREKYLCREAIYESLGQPLDAKNDKKNAAKSSNAHNYSLQTFDFPLHN